MKNILNLFKKNLITIKGHSMVNKHQNNDNDKLKKKYKLLKLLIIVIHW